MRVCFVDNILVEHKLGRIEVRLQPHLGLISLVSIARAEGCDAFIYDPKIDIHNGNLMFDTDLYSAVADNIQLRDPDVIGFTALGCNFVSVWKIAGELKRRDPSKTIMLGGPHASILDREIMLANSPFDIIFRKEAELSFQAFIRNPDRPSWHQIDGVTFRSTKVGNEITRTQDQASLPDLRHLPFPSYDAYPVGSLGIEKMPIEAGRGCPFSCTFCSTASFFGRLFRMKPTERIVEEIVYLKDNYSLQHFDISHDLFTVNKKIVHEFCDGVADLDISWTCSARTDCVDEELLTHMAESGCTGIYFGIETGSSRIQVTSRKKLNLSKLDEIVNVSVINGLKVTLSFISGFPDEELEDFMNTVEMMSRFKAKFGDSVLLQLHLLTPEPGTDLLNTNIESMKFDGYTTDFNLPIIDQADRDLIHYHSDIFSNHYYIESKIDRPSLLLMVSSVNICKRLPVNTFRDLFGENGEKFTEFLLDINSFINTDDILIDVDQVSTYSTDAIIKVIKEKQGSKLNSTLARIYVSMIAMNEDVNTFTYYDENGSERKINSNHKFMSIGTERFKLSNILFCLDNCLDVIQHVDFTNLDKVKLDDDSNEFDPDQNGYVLGFRRDAKCPRLSLCFLDCDDFDAIRPFVDSEGVFCTHNGAGRPDDIATGLVLLSQLGLIEHEKTAA